MKRISVSLALAATLCGCVSSLNVQRYDDTAPQVGYPYRLRFTQYQVTATWRVVSCDPNAPIPLKIKTTAEIKETTGLDPDQFYVIDPRSLQGLFRTTEFTMEWYEDRTPKSISSDVDDQTGAAIGNVLTGLSKLASAGLGFPGGPPSDATKCSKAVTDALTAINGKPGDKKNPGQKAVTDAAQKAVDAQTAIVTKLNADATAMGATLDRGTRDKLGAARARLEALLAVLTLEQGKLKELNDVLTETKTVTWPDAGSEMANKIGLKPSVAAQKRWNLDESSSVMVFMRLTPIPAGKPASWSPDTSPAPVPTPPLPPAPAPTPTPQPTATTGTDTNGGWPAGNTTARGGVAPVQPVRPAPAAPVQPVAAQPAPQTDRPKPRTRTERAATGAIPGLPYREPGRVRLDVCLARPCDGSPDELDTQDRLIASSNGLALQAGTMMYLPFRAQTFAHIKNSAGFAQSGVLTSAGSSQLRGAGSGATDALSGASTQVAAIADARRGAETKRLTAAADEAKAKKALADAEAALSPNPNADDLAKIAAFQTEATLATAEKARDDAVAALAASQAAAGK
jgi:hypothetical protein